MNGTISPDEPSLIDFLFLCVFILNMLNCNTIFFNWLDLNHWRAGFCLRKHEYSLAIYILHLAWNVCILHVDAMDILVGGGGGGGGGIPDSAETRLDSFNPQLVVDIDLPHQGVVDSYNPIQPMLWLLVIWWRQEPSQQQPWYWASCFLMKYSHFSTTSLFGIFSSSITANNIIIAFLYEIIE